MANARPVSVAAVSTATPQAPETSPNPTMTRTNAALEVSTRKATYSMWPAITCSGLSGVETVLW